MRLFAILYQPGPAWEVGVPLQEQDLSEHAAHMRECAQTGAVALAGPLLDTGGGLVIVGADGLAQAKEVMDADPAVPSELFAGTLSSWIPIIDPRPGFSRRMVEVQQPAALATQAARRLGAGKLSPDGQIEAPGRVRDERRAAGGGGCGDLPARLRQR